MYIDSHAHLSDPPLLPKIEEIIERARRANITKLINICTHVKALQEGLGLSIRYPEIFNVGCTPPHDVEKETEASFLVFEQAAKEGRLVAIGETGLDYYYKELPRPLQHEVLKKYLQLAIDCDLPVVFHCREAFLDLFALTDLYYPNRPAVLHCFTGTLEEAIQVLQRGWYLSLSGILTFPKSHLLREIAQKAPLSQLLLETDAPFLAPQPHRGKMNEPAYLVDTAACLAEIKQMPIEEIASITANNARKLFRI